MKVKSYIVGAALGLVAGLHKFYVMITIESGFLWYSKLWWMLAVDCEGAVLAKT